MRPAPDAPVVNGNRGRPSPPRPHRRALASRLSPGHLLMIVAGLLAALMNYSLLRSRDDTVQVAVATQDIHPGDELSGAVGTARVRVDDGVLPALVAPRELKTGQVATVFVPEGEPLRRSDLRDPAASNGLRAMSVPIDPAHAVAGDLEAGDRVDVITVLKGGARYIAMNVEVIAARSAGAGGALPGVGTNSVTLAVDAQTALRLATAIRADAVELIRSTGAMPVSLTADGQPER